VPFVRPCQGHADHERHEQLGAQAGVVRALLLQGGGDAAGRPRVERGADLVAHRVAQRRAHERAHHGRVAPPLGVAQHPAQQLVRLGRHLRRRALGERRR
jgi:hypothetical protein